jgi:membrane protein YqaA with SNARE-associated domain
LFPLSTVKNILKRYSTWIWKVLAPLGPWGVFAIAALDGSLFGMPVDAIVAGYVYNDRPHFLFYVVMASAGSALGSLVIYAIGYFGGETVLRKRISEERFNKIHASFERHEFWALLFPAMLPPPTPFKLFVLAASAFEMRFTHFLAAVFAGRFVRFFVLAVLTIEFGPQFVHLVGELVRQHLGWVLAAAAALVVLGLFAWMQRKNRPPEGHRGPQKTPGSTSERKQD